MTDTEKLQLRRGTCEAIGYILCDSWRLTNMGSAGGPCYMKDRGDCGHETCLPREEIKVMFGHIGGYPHIESDNGLALDALVRFCADKDLAFELTQTHGDYYVCLIRIDGGALSVGGETPAIAICKAICASAKKEARSERETNRRSI